MDRHLDNHNKICKPTKRERHVLHFPVFISPSNWISLKDMSQPQNLAFCSFWQLAIGLISCVGHVVGVWGGSWACRDE